MCILINMVLKPSFSIRAQLSTSVSIVRRIDIDQGYMMQANLEFALFFYIYRDYSDEKNISLFNEVRKEFFSAGLQCKYLQGPSRGPW